MEKKSTPFVDYYNSLGHVPTSQDFIDPTFIAKRDYLYSTMGIPLSMLSNKDILEFGPGGGFNAIATSQHIPNQYVFVDAIDWSLEQVSKKSREGLIKSHNIEMVKSDIFEFRDVRKFDLVIIEGVISGQREPEKMIQHAGSFVKPGGILVTTTTTGSSYLSEICRKLFRVEIIKRFPEISDQINEASRIFKSHLESLSTITRPIEDWVLDVVLHKNTEKLKFSIEDTLHSLKDNFNFYNSSPKFFIDDRFYKKVEYKNMELNRMALEQLEKLTLAFLDYRISFKDSISVNIDSVQIENLSMNLMNLHNEIINDNSYSKLDDFLKGLNELAKILPSTCKPTSDSIIDFCTNFPKFISGDRNYGFTEFAKWWGRGQQYLSLIKVNSY